MEYLVLSGSARQDSTSRRIAEHAARLLAKRPDTTARHWNARELGLGDFEQRPGEGGPPSATLSAFLADAARADGFVLVAPEYNHGYPGALKNVLDHLRNEWARKPFALVSTGGVSGGSRAAEQLRQVIPALGGTSIPATVAVPFAMRAWDDDGPPTDEAEDWARRFGALFDDLDWWAGALKHARDGDGAAVGRP